MGEKLLAFDPKKHKKGTQLYELQSEEKDGEFVTKLVKSDVSHEAAARTRWYYFVKK